MRIEDYGNKLKESIKKVLLEHKNGEYLVIDRGMAGNFYHIFADALYDYERGIILIERLFFEYNATPISVKYKTLSKENLEKAKSIRSKLREVLVKDISSSDGEMERQKEIDELSAQCKDITPEIATIEMYKYKNMPLNKLSLYKEEDIDVLSEIYASFAISATMFLGMQDLSQYEVNVSTIKHTDYIDLILVPIKKE